jgi:hypothetical protein
VNRITPEALYQLLPAVHRIRDAEEDEPLRALIAVLAREGAVVEESIEQLLDNAFVETCAPWAVPYVGGTIGYSTLHPIEGQTAGTRAEVANTIGYRRRKGTAAVLEQLAFDVTGWPARVVEYFLVVATCQHMNHVRPRHLVTPDLRNPLPLETLGSGFDPITRSIDVRSIQQAAGRNSIGGKHNLPNIGVFPWRLMPMSLTRGPTTRVDARRYLFDPLGTDPLGPPRQLINRQRPENSISSLAGPINLPVDITRRMLDADPALWYGPDRAIELYLDDTPVPVTRIVACDLSDDGGDWNHSPHPALTAAELAEVEGGDPLQPAENALIRIDPALGRIAFPNPEQRVLRATWHRGFPAPIGGGEYNRAAELQTRPGIVVTPFPGGPHATLQDAVDEIGVGGGIIEIRSNDVLPAPTTIEVAAGIELIVRAGDGFRPILRAAEPLLISGGEGARVTIDGVIIEGAPVRIIPDADDVSLDEVTLAHVTLIPGLSYNAAGGPSSPGASSLEIETSGLEILIERAITGPLVMTDTTNLTLRDSIVDAAAAQSIDSPEGLAISGPGGTDDPAGAVTLHGSTILGRVYARSFPLVSNSILHARAGTGEAPIRALRRQQGCMRFSYVPDGSIVPRRYRCQPQLAIDQQIETTTAATDTTLSAAEAALIAVRIRRWLVPGFTALRSSHPAYCQLHHSAPCGIRRGASDESEMGVYHLLYQPQRETNLRIRISEYLRFGLEAGVFFET